jgi:FkbH-like protein
MSDDRTTPAPSASGEGEFTLAIAATFTAEPLEAPLRFWMRELGLVCNIAFAPYNQVFQQLLDESGLLIKNDGGVNALLLRLEDFRSDAGDHQGAKGPDAEVAAGAAMERNVNDFARALTGAVQAAASSYLIFLCPPSPSALATPEAKSSYALMEKRIASQFAEVPGIEVIPTAELSEIYPVAEYYDDGAEKLAAVPYTPVFYTALATMMARRLHALRSAPAKVIVLDCDGTLWGGVCGEDGAQAVDIDPPRRGLQEFLVRQHDAGMLLALCSKNNEADVKAVFDSRKDMALQRDHIAAWRINWRPKSENLRSLALELGMGLDSFIFIDDDPVECAEVQERCPEVLTLRLPGEPQSIPRFLRHIWPLDRRRATRENNRRTALYRAHWMREEVRREALTLKDFLDSLGLEIRIFPLQASEIGRVSELTRRTNQFNLTTIRRSEAEIRKLREGGKTECWVVNVKDRFGDYGLVGVIVFEARAESLVVDTLLLSCRALGRGVEHTMLARLGEIALSRGLAQVELRCVPSAKNRPAMDFVDALETGCKEFLEDGFLLKIPADTAASVSYKPDAGGASDPLSTQSARVVPVPNPAAAGLIKTAVLSSIPESLYDAKVIHQLISQAQPRRDDESSFVPPQTPTQKQLAEIYSEFLCIEPIGVHDSFFNLGGHSLSAMQALARIRETFQVDLPPTLFFTTNFTVAELEREIVNQQAKRAGPGEIAAMLKELSQLTDEEVDAFLHPQPTPSRDR